MYASKLSLLFLRERASSISSLAGGKVFCSCLVVQKVLFGHVDVNLDFMSRASLVKSGCRLKSAGMYTIAPHIIPIFISRTLCGA